jgi:magnesium transporter
VQRGLTQVVKTWLVEEARLAGKTRAKTEIMFGKLLGPEIQSIIQQRNFAALKDALAEWPPADMAELIGDLPPADQVIVFRILPQQLAANTFAYLTREDQERLLQTMGRQDVVAIISDMSPDDRTALLEELPASAVVQLLQLLRPEERAIAQNLLGYPEKSVGRLMTPDFIAAKDYWTVQQVLDHVRQVGIDSETINNIYVTDESRKLVDDVHIREFLLRPPSAKVAEIRDHTFVALKATDSEEEAIRAFRKYDRTALPVVDSEGKLVGIVTVDDILDVADQEATEDIHKGGAIKPLTTSLLKARFKELYARRVTWLVILVFMNIFSGAVIAHFEELIESVVALVFFLPLLIDSSGNAGSQAATLVIRSIALGEIRLRDYIQVLWRETWVALLLGLTMAAAVFFLALWRSGLDVARVVSLSMLIVVFIGSLIGMSLPFILSKLKVDPAAASAPLVTSLADIAGVLIYLSIAKALLGMAAH